MRNGKYMINIGDMIDFCFRSEVKVSYGKALFEPFLRRGEEVLAARLRELLDGKRGELNLVLIDDAEMRKVNREYRGKDKATDVISFAYFDGEAVVGERLVVGDVLISVDTARRQAKEHGVSLKRELQVLFVHGFLHCLGFDHNDDREEAEMEGWAGRILEEVF